MNHILKIRVFSLIWMLAGALVALPRLAHAERSPLEAAKDLANLAGFDLDPGLDQTLQAYAALVPTEQLDAAKARALIEQREIHKWSAHVAEFQGLVDLIVNDVPTIKREDAHGWLKTGQRFEEGMTLLDQTRKDLNAYVSRIHPGMKFLNATQLQALSRGRGVRIAIFDLFEEDLLRKQRLQYAGATIHDPQNFGRPVTLRHGNTVIDIILSLAPDAEIFPIATDAKSYAAALQSLAARDDIDMVNMSRAFAPAADQKSIEPAFADALRTLMKQQILCKSLGNTGTDLLGHPTRRRQELGLGPAANLFAYDLTLIDSLYPTGEATEEDFLLFGLNLAPYADAIALSASIPGSARAIQRRTLGVPADGIWSFATESYEAGSSFAAPQLCGLAALLLAKNRTQFPSLSRIEHYRQVTAAILQSAELHGQIPDEFGRGLPGGDRALSLLLSGRRAEP